MPRVQFVLWSFAIEMSHVLPSTHNVGFLYLSRENRILINRTLYVRTVLYIVRREVIDYVDNMQHRRAHVAMCAMFLPHISHVQMSMFIFVCKQFSAHQLFRA